MSLIRLRIELSGIDSKQEVDALEHHLRSREGVELHEVGLSAVELSYDQHTMDTNDIERIVEQAGGKVRALHRIE